MERFLTTRLALLFALTVLSCEIASAQIVFPGGGINSISDVPGLTNELGRCVTNIIDGGATGNTAGQVNKIDGRNYQIKFPSVQPLTTNSCQSQFNIDPSGSTLFTFPVAFTSPPYVSFTLADTNVTQVVTPVIETVTTTNCTVRFVSAGTTITNAWLVYYNASLGYAWGVYGVGLPNIAGLTDGTNVYRRDGTFGMTAPMYMPGGAAASTWLAGDASGYGTWQTRSSGNMTDGAELLKRNGSVAWTGTQNANNNSLVNLLGLHMPGGGASGRVMGSDAYGNATWQDWGAQNWYTFPVGSTLNMNGYSITGAGTIWAANGIFSGNLSADGTLTVGASSTFNGLATFKNGISLTTAGSLTSDRPIYANNGLTIQTAGILSVNRPAYFYSSIDNSGGNTFTTDGKINLTSNAGCEGKKIGVAGINSWVQIDCWRSGAPVLYIPNGYIQSKGFWSAGDVQVVGNLNVTGSKSFRIDHPLNSNKYLYHGSIEAPRNDLIYRGTATLVAGTATVSIDTASLMTPGTFVALTKNPAGQAWNNASFTRVRVASIVGAEVTILAETNTCNDLVNWVVYAERNDSGITNSPTYGPGGVYQPEVNK